MKPKAATVILAIIAATAGILAVINIFRYLQWMFSNLDFVLGQILGAIFAFFIAVIWLWVAVRIYVGDRRAWIFMIVIAGINLILDLISIISGTPIELHLGSLAINILILILGLLPSTREEFEAQ